MGVKEYFCKKGSTGIVCKYLVEMDDGEIDALTLEQIANMPIPEAKPRQSTNAAKIPCATNNEEAIDAGLAKNTSRSDRDATGVPNATAKRLLHKTQKAKKRARSHTMKGRSTQKSKLHKNARRRNNQG